MMSGTATTAQAAAAMAMEAPASAQGRAAWAGEIEVMPGVFFTPAPGRRLQQGQGQSGPSDSTSALVAIIEATVSDAQAAVRLAASAGVAGGCQVLQIEIERLSNSVFHLNRSNTEILEFDPDDPELREAVAENKIVIRNQQLRIAVLHEMIQHIAAGHPAEAFVPPEPAALAHLAKSHHASSVQVDATQVQPGQEGQVQQQQEQQEQQQQEGTPTAQADGGMWL